LREISPWFFPYTFLAAYHDSSLHLHIIYHRHEITRKWWCKYLFNSKKLSFCWRSFELDIILSISRVSESKKNNFMTLLMTPLRLSAPHTFLRCWCIDIDGINFNISLSRVVYTLVYEENSQRCRKNVYVILLTFEDCLHYLFVECEIFQ
jgi:hypothetical protein